VRTHSRTYNKQCPHRLAVTAILYIEHSGKYQCPLYRAWLGSSRSWSVDPQVPATVNRTIRQVKDRSSSLHCSSPLCLHRQDCDRENCVTHVTLSSRQTNFTKSNISFTDIHVTHTLSYFLLILSSTYSGPGSSVGIATDYGLDGSGIESRWGRDFSHTSRPALGQTLFSCTTGTGSFPGVKRPGRGADHPHPPSAEVENKYLYSPSRPLVACYRVDHYLLSSTYIQNTRVRSRIWFSLQVMKRTYEVGPFTSYSWSLSSLYYGTRAVRRMKTEKVVSEYNTTNPYIKQSYT
jgi:hypothetical protein